MIFYKKGVCKGENMIYSWNWISKGTAAKMFNLSIEQIDELISNNEIETIDTEYGTRVVFTSLKDYIMKTKQN